ncbi:carboxymuconolactone decarboxylase family protein [Sorangium cellulosum]|uniref:Alkylhydroperoxidase n=1 Tax=Sorangium cellulosum TaxID=56 RepID=A0A150QWS2_SORCE|nr:carboxymuconolactone decarboxylase family protein [Sorangium cellulosum]KYF72420.1 alkylhydroperoxidase [Sorangium cellulosum]
MSEQSAVKYEQEIPDVLQALAGVHKVVDGYGLDRKLIHLVQLRASQINQCAFCVKMHTREARQDGETNDRLDRVVVWEHVRDFSERERAALAWTEALTVLDRRTDYAALRARLREHFSDREIGALTAAVAMINLWNRIQVSGH